MNEIRQNESRTMQLEHMLKSTVIFSVVAFGILIGLCFIFSLQLDKGWGNPNPKPPVVDKIITKNAQELELVKSALSFVKKEHDEGKYENDDQAIEAIDIMMGSPDAGVTQEVQDKVIAEFTGGKGFKEAMESVSKKLQ